MVEFKELQSGIVERQNRVRILRHQIPGLLGLDEKSRIIIDPDSKDEAKEIAAKIKELRARNEKDAAILAKAQAISERWNLPIGDFHRLDYLETQTHDHLAELQSQLQSTLKTLNFSPDNSAAAHRQQNLVEQITQAKEYLEKIAGAKKELAGIISE